MGGDKLNFYMDGEAVAVGFPNQEKKLFVQNMPGAYFAVTEGCETKDTAFDFLNYICFSVLISIKFLLYNTI